MNPPSPLPIPLPSPAEVLAARTAAATPVTLPVQPRCFYTFQYDDVDMNQMPIKMMASDWNNLLAGKTYRIEASTDLKTWQEIGSQAWDDTDPASYLRIVRQIKPGCEFIRLAMV